MFLMRNKKNSQNYFQYPTLSAAQNPIKKCLCSLRAFSLSSLRSVLAMHLSSLYVYYTFIFVFFLFPIAGLKIFKRLPLLYMYVSSLLFC